MLEKKILARIIEIRKKKVGGGGGLPRISQD